MKLKHYLLGGFFLIFLSFLSCEDPKAETIVEVGVPFITFEVRKPVGAIILIERFDKWDIGLGLIGPQLDKYGREIRNNLVLFGQRRTCYKRFCSGFGLAYMGHTSPVLGSKLNYILSIEFTLRGRSLIPDYIIIRHISNGGTESPNYGQDFLNIGYSFGK